MPNFKTLKALVSMVIPSFLLIILVGCAGLEVNPDGTWHPRELAAAKRAVEAAKKAGKDKECPEEFKAVEKLQKDAYATYQSCRTKQGIEMANEAASKAAALCPKKVAEAPPSEPKPAPPPAAAKPAPPAATASLSANPASIRQGQCATLTWSSRNASRVSIDQGVGSVDTSGSRQVCPNTTTQYTISAAGEGASGSASTTVTVSRVVDRLTLHANFDFNKAAVRSADAAELQKGIDFLRKYPDSKVSLEGYTDSIGSEAYNQGLSERRAAAVKTYLLEHGVTDGARITTSGHGESDPIADNSTEQGRFQNRRVEILILSE